MSGELKRLSSWSWRLLLALVLAGILYLLPAGNRPVAAQNCQYNHYVYPGQNLFRISKQYGTTIDAIAAANGIQNVNLIYAGSTLCIPPVSDGGTGGQPAPGTGTVYNCYYLNVRSGPAVIYNVLQVVSQGTQMDVLGRNSFSTWLQVRAPNGQIGWVNAYYLYSGTPISDLPVVG